MTHESDRASSPIILLLGAILIMGGSIAVYKKNFSQPPRAAKNKSSQAAPTATGIASTTTDVFRENADPSPAVSPPPIPPAAEPTPPPKVKTEYTTAEKRAAIHALFATLSKAVRENNPALFAKRIDGDTLYDLLISQAGKKLGEKFPRKQFLRSVLMGVAKRFIEQVSLARVDRLTVHTIFLSKQRKKAVVIVRGENKNIGITIEFRFYISEQNKAWQVYDMEVLDTGIRISVALRVVSESAFLENSMVRDVFQQLVRVQQLLTEGKINDGKMILAGISPEQIPRYLQKIYWLNQGLIFTREEDSRNVLTAANELSKIDNDQPFINYLRAVAYRDLKQYDRAIKATLSYLAQLGSDAEAFEILGTLYVANGKPAEAEAAFRKGLADNPNYPGNALGLIRVLPTERKKEILPFLKKIKSPANALSVIAQDLLDHNDDAELAVIVDGFRAIGVTHVDLGYYQAQLYLRRKEFSAAQKVIEAVLPRVTGKGELPFFHDVLREALVGQGEWTAAYVKSLHPRKTYETLADILVARKQWAALDKLTDIHAVKFANDHWILFYRGKIAFAQKKFADAGAYYLAAYHATSKGDAAKEDRAIALRECAFAYASGGLGIQQYKKIQEKETLFFALADVYAEDEATKLLAQLLTLRHQDKPAHGAEEIWYAELLWLRKNYVALLPALQQARQQLPAQHDQLWRYHDRRVRALIRLKKFAAATRAATAADKQGEPWYQAVVLAASGKSAAATQAIILYLTATGKNKADDCAYIYDDADIGKILRTNTYAALHTKYPIPAPKPTPPSQPPAILRQRGGR